MYSILFLTVTGLVQQACAAIVPAVNETKLLGSDAPLANLLGVSAAAPDMGPIPGNFYVTILTKESVFPLKTNEVLRLVLDGVSNLALQPYMQPVPARSFTNSRLPNTAIGIKATQGDVLEARVQMWALILCSIRLHDEYGQFITLPCEFGYKDQPALGKLQYIAVGPPSNQPPSTFLPAPSIVVRSPELHSRDNSTPPVTLLGARPEFYALTGDYTDKAIAPMRLAMSLGLVVTHLASRAPTMYRSFGADFFKIKVSFNDRADAREMVSYEALVKGLTYIFQRLEAEQTNFFECSFVLFRAGRHLVDGKIRSLVPSAE